MKILFLDIETRPILCYTWGTFKQDITLDQILENSGMICWAAKWLGEKEVLWGRGPKRIHALMCEADAVCTYNGISFDDPRLQTEFLKAGLPPTPNVPHLDLKRVIAKKFWMDSTKLAFVGPFLGIGEKIKNSGWSLWKACLDGDADAWKKMRRYNEQDVVLLEKLYEKILPWIDNHPNRNKGMKCPSCGSSDLQRRGTHRALVQEYQRFQCKSCGRWSRSRKAIPGQAALVR